MRLFAASVAVATVLLMSSTGAVLAQSVSPSPSAPADEGAPQAAELIALFPEEIGGQPLRETVTVEVGEEHLSDLDPNDPDDAQDIESLEALAQAMDSTVADLISASGYVFMEDDTYALVAAFRIAGMDASQAVDPMIAVADGDFVAPRAEPGTIAGRDVTLLYDDGQPEGLPWYLLPSGDTLWLVVAHEPMLTEVFEKLP